MKETPSLEQLLAQANILKLAEIRIQKIEDKQVVSRVKQQRRNMNKYSHNKNYDQKPTQIYKNCGNPSHPRGRYDCPAMNIQCNKVQENVAFFQDVPIKSQF